ncbi:hypothetical protein EYV94_16195 [Puteibacter caeruleilacunae]|nr:hypothetical protein EYV94_16195 [Puteibacter caeruleilacunae]
MITSIKKLCLLFVGIILLQTAFSQENYVDGYIVKLNGDTIKGLIDFRDWENNPNKISFKSTISDTPQLLTPMNINEFGVEDQVYESAVIDAELNSLLTHNLEVDQTIEVRVDTTFLQVCIRGDKSLYRYRLPSRENFYVKIGDKYERLIYHRSLVDRKINGSYKTTVKENKKFIGQLSVYLQDSPGIAQKLRNTQYKTNSLMKVFQAYYSNTDITTTFNKKKEKIITSFGLIAGAAKTTLDFTSDHYTYLSQGDIDSPVGPIAGISLDLILPKHMQKWWLHNELLYSTYKADGTHRDLVHKDRYTDYDFTLESSQIRLVNMVRYVFPKEKFKPFISAGISQLFTIDDSTDLHEVRTYYSSVTERDGEAIPETRKYQQGLVFGAGVIHKDLSLEMRYESTNGMSDYTNLGSSTKHISLLLGYRF